MMAIDTKRHRCSCSRGFTIVEMLVVVSIIMLLIALMLPALGRAREITRRSACQALLAQQAAALATYSSDTEGRYPPGNATITPGLGIDSTYWVGGSRPMGLAFLVVEHYIDEVRTFYCPSWTHPWNQFDVVDVAGNDPWFGPNMMGGWPAEGNAGPTSHRGFAYHYRSSFGLSFNEPPHNISTDGGAAIIADQWVRREVMYGVAYGHTEGYNAAYLDGHASWLPDRDAEFMESRQPVRNNGSWAQQELMWQDFFD